MKVETKIKVIHDEAGIPKSELSILNNSAHPERVILKLGDKLELQVSASELTKAIQNAVNI